MPPSTPSHEPLFEKPDRQAWILPAVSAILSGVILLLLVPLYLQFAHLVGRLTVTPSLRRMFTACLLLVALWLIFRAWIQARKALRLYRQARS
jgi:protein-S-isoprenylcysteine O-methyltransferase Ste14